MVYLIAEYVDYLVILVGFTCTMKFLPLTVKWPKDFKVSCSQILLNQHPILVHLCGEDLIDNLHFKATLEMNEVYMDVGNDFIDNDQVNSLRSMKCQQAIYMEAIASKCKLYILDVD